MLVQRALAAGPPVPIDPDAALARFLAIYAIDPTAATVPYPGVPDALEKLSRRGVPMIVSTNKPAEPSRVILAALGLDRYFGEVIGGDTFSFRKPDPRMVTDPIGRAGIDPAEAVLIGDSEIDAATAEAAGIRFILMTYGYHRGAIETIPCIAALDRFAEIEGVLFDPTA
jgi:phosphoglycolate phosphatase